MYVRRYKILPKIFKTYTPANNNLFLVYQRFYELMSGAVAESITITHCFYYVGSDNCSRSGHDLALLYVS